MTRLLFTLLSLFVFSFAYAQRQSIPCGDYQNISAEYEYKFVKKIEKKNQVLDEYFLKVYIHNKNPEAFFSPSELFIDVQVLNTEKTVYTCSNGADYLGRESNFVTVDNEDLYELPKGLYYTSCSFRVPAGVEPLVDASMMTGFKSIKTYDLLISSNTLEGIWMQAITEETVTINAIKKGLIVTNSENKSLTWEQVDEKNYKRSIQVASSEAYFSNLEVIDENTISYTNSEGIHSLWERQ